MSSSEQVFDTSEMEAERDRLADKMALLSDKMQATINENARVAIDQRAYEKRHGELAERYGSVKGKHDEVMKAIADKVSAKTASQRFITTLWR